LLRACATSTIIDSELRLLAAVRRSIREHGGEPSSRQVDELLDERSELNLKLTDRPTAASAVFSRFVERLFTG
jgi:hypothetical protein